MENGKMPVEMWQGNRGTSPPAPAAADPTLSWLPVQFKVVCKLASE